MAALEGENGPASVVTDEADTALDTPIVSTMGLSEEESRFLDECREAKAMSEPRLDFGLNIWNMDEVDSDEWWRRQRLHIALRHNTNQRGISSPWLLIEPFTEADLQGTVWRPWPKPVPSEDGAAEVSESTRVKSDRFRAVLEAIAQEHEERHWFFQHPFCRVCFPDDLWYDQYAKEGYRNRRESVVAPRLANWMLRHGERGFPGDTWDGALPPEPDEASVIDFMGTEDLAALPEPGWLIDGVLPDSGTGILRARDQSYKSFMALKMALEVIDNGGRVLYCVGEGLNNFRHRIDAWLEDYGDDDADRKAVDEGLDLLPTVPNLFAGGNLYDRVLARARERRYDLIVVDTYARAVAGSDLNSQGDQSLVTARVDELKRATDGTVLLVAHSQKTDSDASGSIEIEDSRDFVFAMKRTGNEVTFEVTKQKDGVESSKPRRFVARQVGRSMVLEEVSGDTESIMTSKDWIVASLHATKDLGARSESEIRGWINDHENRRKAMPRSTCSSELSRMVESGQVLKSGSRYALPGPQEVAL